MPLVCTWGLTDNGDLGMPLRGRHHWHERLMLQFPWEQRHDLSPQATGRTSGFGQEPKDRSVGSTSVRTFIGVSEKKARENRVNGLGLARWNNFSGLWAMGVVSSCLVPGPGVSKAEHLSLGVPARQRTQVPALGHLQIKSMLPAESFAWSKNWLAPPEAGCRIQKSFLRTLKISLKNFLFLYFCGVPKSLQMVTAAIN